MFNIIFVCFVWKNKNSIKFQPGHYLCFTYINYNIIDLNPESLKYEKPVALACELIKLSSRLLSYFFSQIGIDGNNVV